MSENPLYQTGDQVTIKRGKHAGKQARVLDVTPSPEPDETIYSVKYADGGYGAVNQGNVKAPVEKTITATTLGEIVMEHINELPTAFIDQVRAVLDGQEPNGFPQADTWDVGVAQNQTPALD